LEAPDVPILVNCPCGKQLQAKDEFAGKRTRCPDCGNPLVIPEDDGDPLLTDQGEAKQGGGGNNRFLATVIVLAVVALIGSVSLINWNIRSRERAEVRAKLHESLSEALQTANASILKGDYAKASDALRKAAESKPAVDPDDPNTALLSEAEALLATVDVAATDSKASAYLQSLDDAKLASIPQGQNDLTARLSDPKVKEAINARLARLVPSIQEERSRLAQEKLERERATDPVYQREALLSWLRGRVDELLKRDSELRAEIRKMEAGFKDRAYNSVAVSRPAVDQVLGEWSERRAKLLADRMKEMKEKTEELVKEMAKHPALHLGTKDDQLRLADEVGALLKTLVKQVDEPVENQLAAWEQSYGGSLSRGVSELEDLNRQMRDTNRMTDDLFKGRIPRSR
jgi:hypothetical protein